MAATSPCVATANADRANNFNAGPHDFSRPAARRARMAATGVGDCGFAHNQRQDRLLNAERTLVPRLRPADWIVEVTLEGPTQICDQHALTYSGQRRQAEHISAVG